MTDFVVGDIQGCFDPLISLLEKIDFDPTKDRLIAAGDLVNRGPKSLDTMRYCKNLGSAFKMVLGNHDLHLLAIAHGVKKPTPKDTIGEILAAPDASVLLEWLQQQPLMLGVDNFTIVHAGIPPQWTLPKALSLAKEVHTALTSANATSYFEHMYGNHPTTWSDDLEGPERLRVITNYLTRMRFCAQDGQLDLETKHAFDAPHPFYPWFSHPLRKTRGDKVVFGHWASLEGRDCGENLFALDTGCVWGGPLRAMNLENQHYFHQP
ncbi:symmetrical bis(5'-nucleosyl)-tetraphosphatase [Gammaproteobacteria bacterium]|nr:symmetrical bis(5'-nucleosyl)-tetraphosphatase [Gammaproteobacteria bacterium]